MNVEEHGTAFEFNPAAKAGARVEVRDNSLWVSHISGDDRLAAQLLSLKQGQSVTLSIDGVTGFWEKMKDGSNGAATPGLKPIGKMKQIWRQWYTEQRFAALEISMISSGANGRRKQLTGDQAIAVDALLDAAKNSLGRSDDRKYSRDDLHER